MIPVITTIPLLQLASGDRLYLQVYKFIGAQSGKKTYLQANLHGAEIAGNAVIHDLIEWLRSVNPEQLVGEIWLVPVCNPLGTNQRANHFSSGRFNSYDGRDWNRIFWDYQKTGEDLLTFAQSQLGLDPAVIQRNYRQRIWASFSQLSQKFTAATSAPFHEHYRFQLQSLCLDADYVIDLHTSADQGLDYLYYFRDREAAAQLFRLTAGVLLDEYDGDAFDEAFIKPWLALEDCFMQLGQPTRFEIEAWTLELGSAMQFNPVFVEKAIQGIKNYLAQKEVLKVAGFPLTQPPESEMKLTVRSKVKKYYAPVGGMIQSRVALGTTVAAGERLYQILSFNKEAGLPTVIDVQAEQAGLVFDLALNQAANQGEYVLGVL
jgi:predicted deacylase